MIKSCVVTFDFDDTLAFDDYLTNRNEVSRLRPITLYCDLLREYHALGLDCYILTARNDSKKNVVEIESFLYSQNLFKCVKSIIFTNGELKGEFAKKVNSSLHYDDSLSNIESVGSFGIKTVLSAASKDMTLDDFQKLPWR